MTYQILENNNNKLLNENNQLKTEGEDLKNSLNVLKHLVQQREEEFLDTLKIKIIKSFMRIILKI
jgi:hypothetical protein